MSYCFNPNCEQPKNPRNSQFCQTCGNVLLLKQRYRAIKTIGQGGFGRTLLSVDEDKPSKPACVIKQFLPQAQGTNNIKKAAELFEQEAERLDKLGKHNQIPDLFAYLIQDENQCLIQEYIDGHNLRQILSEQGNFKEEQIWELLNSLLPVIEFIHQNEVIHRDIKPENIILSRDGKLFLVDFGAAKVVTGTAMLQTGTSIGTPEFIAPEQARGKAIYGSDLYSLGTTCIYLLTGVSPFDLFDISEYKWVWRQYLVDNPVSDKLSHILDKLIDNATSSRYQSAKEVLEDINSQNKYPWINNEDCSDITSELSPNSTNIKLLNSSTWECINTFYTHTDCIDSIDISSDGRILVSGSHDNQIKIWEISTGKQIRTLNHENLVYAVAFSPNREIIASGGFENNIYLWDSISGNKIHCLKGHTGWFAGVNSLRFSPDGRILVSAGGDKTVKLWDINTGKEIRTLQGHSKWVSSVAISPDGKIIVSGSHDKTAILWNLNTGEIMHTLSHSGTFAGVNSVAFNPNGKMIATASDDYKIKLWEVITGQEICTFQGHEDFVRYVTFNATGELLASSSHSNDIKLWDINKRQELFTITGHLNKVNSIVFSPDGKTLFSGSDDKSIKIWKYR